MSLLNYLSRLAKESQKNAFNQFKFLKTTKNPLSNLQALLENLNTEKKLLKQECLEALKVKNMVLKEMTSKKVPLGIHL